ncbi:IQ motif containing B1, transcript variant X4 [Ictidomys tridecemlineatus]|uniref:IQ calmodulin-binding motif-containing protein 1 isoform X2 n=1 Tax=Ictidomys tridecemlineatus TaxID=43179 RepID=UPI00038BBD1D|nr:IQ calmodulin-binding motif-containing protein 1 isoform X2 [Ictidomys tridecemlineatus]KAG3271359.1 IQ motif containing B1, transcript variant X4 [Ictidomys tridecemlineatus]
MKPTGTDPRILSLAAEVAKSPEQNVPVILLKLKEIINNTPLGSSELKKIKQDIYCYDLIQYCLLVLGQDCSRIQGGWTTISQLTQILSHCCVGLDPGEDAEEFYKELLPSAAENFLILGRRLQTCFINAAKGEEKDEILHFFQIVTDSLFWLLGGHVQLIQNVLQSDHFLHLLQTDNVQIGSIVMTLLQNILRINRSKRTKTQLKLNRKKEEEDLRLQLQLQRQRAMRLSRELRLSMLEIVHPGQLEKYNREMEEKSALIIQKYWRGYRERKKFYQQRPSLTEYKAAVTLQRAVLKFLAKCRKRKKQLAPWQRLQELTDARRVELKQQVDDYIRRHSGSQISGVASRELHAQAQEQLQHYFMGRTLEERAQQHREALMAQISTNIEQLMKAPSLKEAEGKEPELFLSRSRPVAAKAKQAHLTTLKHIQAPWWKKLGEEPGDEIDVPKDELSIELGTLFIGGTKPP